MWKYNDGRASVLWSDHPVAAVRGCMTVPGNITRRTSRSLDLDLEGNEIGDDGASALAQALQAPLWVRFQKSEQFFRVLDAVDFLVQLTDVMRGCCWRPCVSDHTDFMFGCLRRSQAHLGTRKVKRVLAHGTPCSAGEPFAFTPLSARTENYPKTCVICWRCPVDLLILFFRPCGTAPNNSIVSLTRVCAAAFSSPVA